MEATIFVSDGTQNSVEQNARARKLREVKAYLYDGWSYKGWGTAPASFQGGGTGFFFRGPATGGFGAQPVLERLRSGLHFGVLVEEHADEDPDERVEQRVRLVRTSDPYTNLQPGDEGAVMMIDDIGTLHVRWDNGSTLGLVPGEDDWVLVR